jgi:hypothetical protein
MQQQRSKAQDLVKWIAMLTMVIDHLRFIFPAADTLIIIGRLAFPLFCLAIAANVQRIPVSQTAPHSAPPIPFSYLARLGIFALISELPYRLLRPDADTLNIMPTLLLGLLVCLCLHYRSRASLFAMTGLLAISVVANQLLMYGALGVLLPAACLTGLRYGREFVLLAMLLSMLCNTSFDALKTVFDPTFSLNQHLLLLSAFLAPAFGILLLKQKISFTVYPVGRWGYWFYPVHLLAIYFIKIIK